MDLLLAVIVGTAVSVLYTVLAWRIAQGHFYEHFNLVFDYDSPAYVNLFAPKPGSHTDGFGRAVKHPLITWLVVFAKPFTLLGMTRLHAVGLAGALAGGASTALLFLFARRCGTPLIEALLVTMIFAFGAGQLFPSMLAESYVYAALTIGVVWYLSALRIGQPRRVQSASVLAAVMTFGVTITNVAQAAIAECYVRLSGSRVVVAIRNTIVVGTAVAILAAFAVALTWPNALAYAFAHPERALRLVYWQQTKGPRTGLLPVIATFFGMSLAAPHFTTAPLPEGILMRDFRNLDMPFPELEAVAVWLVLLFASAFLSLRSAATRYLAGALVTAIVFNVIFHVWVQFRGSLFIYTPHVFFPICALVGLGAAAWQPGNERLRWYLRGTLAAVLVVIAPLNLARAVELAALFDKSQTFTIPAQGP